MHPNQDLIPFHGDASGGGGPQALFCPVGGGGGCFVDNVSEGWGISLTNPVWGARGVKLSWGSRCVWSIVGRGLIKALTCPGGGGSGSQNCPEGRGGLWLYVCPGGGGVWKKMWPTSHEDNFRNSPKQLAASNQVTRSTLSPPSLCALQQQTWHKQAVQMMSNWHLSQVAITVLTVRFCNLWSSLRHQYSEHSYLEVQQSSKFHLTLPTEEIWISWSAESYPRLDTHLVAQ